MGVLACDRNECENIMCDRYSREYGYICNECFVELVNSGISFEFFMYSQKNLYKKHSYYRRDCEREFKLTERVNVELPSDNE